MYGTCETLCRALAAKYPGDTPLMLVIWSPEEIQALADGMDISLSDHEIRTVLALSRERKFLPNARVQNLNVDFFHHNGSRSRRVIIGQGALCAQAVRLYLRPARKGVMRCWATSSAAFFSLRAGFARLQANHNSSGVLTNMVTISSNSGRSNSKLMKSD